MSTQTKYMREGRGICKHCGRERDVVVPSGLTRMPAVISRHIVRMEEYRPAGAWPAGFCPGSLAEANPVPVKQPEPKRSR